MTAQQIREKTSARRVLAILVGLLATVMALQGLASVKPGGFQAFAQTTSSPTPSDRVAQPGLDHQRRELQQEGNSRRAERHSRNQTRLSPGGVGHAGARERRWSSSSSRRRAAHAPTRSPARTTTGLHRGPDTFESEPSNVIGMSPRPRGHLASDLVRAHRGAASDLVQQQAVIINEEPVSINNQDPARGPGPRTSVENQNTVEITYPQNGGQVGFYTPPGSNVATGVIDVVASALAPRRVRVLYSESAPGTEPAFQPCGEIPRANAADGVRCRLGWCDRPSQSPP